MKYANVEAMGDHAPDEHCKATIPYTVGALRQSAFRDLLAYGRTFLDVEHYPAGGWLVRRGCVKVSGRWQDVRWYLQLWEKLAKESS